MATFEQLCQNFNFIDCRINYGALLEVIIQISASWVWNKGIENMCTPTKFTFCIHPDDEMTIDSNEENIACLGYQFFLTTMLIGNITISHKIILTLCWIPQKHFIPHNGLVKLGPWEISLCHSGTGYRLHNIVHVHLFTRTTDDWFISCSLLLIMIKVETMEKTCQYNWTCLSRMSDQQWWTLGIEIILSINSWMTLYSFLLFKVSVTTTRVEHFTVWKSWRWRRSYHSLS